MDAITEYVVDEMSTDFYTVDVETVTMLDYKCFYITGKDAADMQWPKEVMSEFIAIVDEGQYSSDEKVRIVKKYKRMYLEKQEKRKGTEFRVCVARTGKDKFFTIFIR